MDVAGNLGGRRHGLGAAASDLELSARNIELGQRARVMDAKLFNSEQVLARGDA